MISSREIRANRLKQTVSENEIISDRAYNLIIGGVLLYGLIMNAILCNFSSQIAMIINPLVLIIGYFVLSIVGILIASKSHNPFISFLGYNLLCLPLGLVISVAVESYGGIDSNPVQMAFIFTIGITLIMVCLATIYPRLFEKLGKALFISLIALLIIGILAIFIQGLSFIYSILGAGLFSLYIGYDIYRSQQFAKTADNAVDSTIDIYLDITNLFLFLLRIFGRGK